MEVDYQVSPESLEMMNQMDQYGQAMDPEMAAAAGGMAIAAFGVVLVLLLIIIAVFYVYFALVYSKLAKKTNTEDAWLAWIPIANIYLLLKIAGKPGWWLILYFVPLVNIVVAIIVWMEIARRLNKPDWLGILVIVPMANLVMPGYLAFSKSAQVSASQGGTMQQNPVARNSGIDGGGETLQ